MPVDLCDSFRAVFGATKDAEFTAMVQRIIRDVDRYTGNVGHVDWLVRRLAAALAVLEDAESIFSDAFVVPPRLDFGFIPASSSPSTRA